MVAVAIFAIGAIDTLSAKPLNVRGDVISVPESPKKNRIEPQKQKFTAKGLSVDRRVSPEQARIRHLASVARREAKNGGVICPKHGCATPKLKWLVRQLLLYRFKPAGERAVRTADCIVRAESGYNPGAISDTNDYSVLQANRPTHEKNHPGWWRRARGFRYLIFDPVYAVGVMWSMSKRGTSWIPWTGTWGEGMCRY